MKAVLVREGGALSYEDFDDPVAGPGEVVVEVHAAAVNRRELLVRNPPGPAHQFELPLVPGSDGAGMRRDTGEEVVIYPAIGWGDCEDAAGPDYALLGGPAHGTYAELVKVPKENVFPKPARVSWGGGGDAARRGAHGLPRALHDRRARARRGTIWPGEVENALYAHPDVLEAVVVAGPDGKADATPIAVVVLKAGGSASEAELIDWCEARVGRAKAPTSVEFRRELLPRSPVGKVVRQPIRDLLWGREHSSRR